ncbi:hypothetical protein E3P81_02986 [Wallemia ichthyophaga]|nr:hypothetical protein E3P97_03120 [Wallemia ichthyophaga]TIB30199.1 hypothetical protein E3P85_02815 [Wallemia ichthyophaga]TIB45167.1 hypothetical protein E3P82_03046 [Wallemia ichthyophaga]TIB48167.1 hypothetical protein E3P81_02986 [Wallemia ichthyophaga]TIB51251.1 hypothetical protein E3P80_03051 [Wallemia ichthyophaga]
MTQQLLHWLSYSRIAGQNAYTIVQQPQTYYGPSIPLGGGWDYGGLTSPTSSEGSSTASSSSSGSSSQTSSASDASSTSSTSGISNTSSTSSNSSSQTSSSSSSSRPSTTSSSSTTSTTSTTSSSSTTSSISSSTTNPPITSSTTTPLPSSSTSSGVGPAAGDTVEASETSDTGKILAIVLPVILGPLLLLLLLLLLRCFYKRKMNKDIERRQFEVTPFLATHQTRPSDADAALYNTAPKPTQTQTQAQSQSCPSTWFAMLGSKAKAWNEERDREKKFTSLPPPRSRGFKTDLSIEDKVTPVQRRQSNMFKVSPLLGTSSSNEKPSQNRPISQTQFGDSDGWSDNQSDKYSSPLDKIRQMRLSMLSNHTVNDDDNEHDYPSTSAGMWGLATSMFPRRSMRAQPPLSGSVGKRVRPYKRIDNDAYSLANDSSSSSGDAYFPIVPTARIDDFYDNSASSKNSKEKSNSSGSMSFKTSSPSPIPPPFAFKTNQVSPSMSSMSQFTNHSTNSNWLNTEERERRMGTASTRSGSYDTASEGYDSRSDSRNASSNSKESTPVSSSSDSSRRRPPVFPRTSDTVFGQMIADKESAFDFGPPRNDYQPVIVEEDEDEDENDGEEEDRRREEAMAVPKSRWKENARPFRGRGGRGGSR